MNFDVEVVKRGERSEYIMYVGFEFVGVFGGDKMIEWRTDNEHVEDDCH